MKEGFVIKTGSSAEITPEQLGKINRYSRRELSPGELYTFSVILCDNEIDRDGERFTVPALKRLAALFVGKTGIFDHNPKGENQTARIFDADLVVEREKKTSLGEPYTCVKASAYMIRSPKTEELILEIDAGIKKEVSVGCSVAKVTCSVCGANLRKEGCAHHKGELVDGKVCHAVLDCPTDAYEWSFVAVPSQRAAGVVKGFPAETPRTAELLLKSFAEASQPLILTEAEQSSLVAFLAERKEDAAFGKAYRAELLNEVIRLSALTDREAEHASVCEVAKALPTEQLLRWRDVYRSRWNEGAPLSPQLVRGKGTDEHNNLEFMI